MIKEITDTMEALYKNDKPFHNSLKDLENMTGVLTKATFSDLQALKNRIHRHNEDLDILDKHLYNFLTVMNDKFQRSIMTLNNNYLAVHMLTKVFKEFPRKFMEFYYICSRAFQDFLSA